MTEFLAHLSCVAFIYTVYMPFLKRPVPTVVDSVDK